MCVLTFSSARYFSAILPQKPSESAQKKTSASWASSNVLPDSSTTVSIMRRRFSISHLRASSMIALRPSNPSASHAGCAARARLTSPATSSALMSGTWATISPVAGFSTGIVFPVDCPF